MKFIMRTVGEVDLSGYLKEIPDLIVVKDKKHNAYDTFQMALNQGLGGGAVHLEDDIILCNNFINRILEIINQHPSDVIQFFSMRKDDLTVGTRYINGSKFLMGQCFYIPEYLSLSLYAYSYNWERIKEHPTGLDTMISDFLKLNKINYLNIVPNLVDHQCVKSRIDPRRSTKRQSLTFNKD